MKFPNKIYTFGCCEAINDPCFRKNSYLPIPADIQFKLNGSLLEAVVSFKIGTRNERLYGSITQLMFLTKGYSGPEDTDALGPLLNRVADLEINAAGEYGHIGILFNNKILFTNFNTEWNTDCYITYTYEFEFI